MIFYYSSRPTLTIQILTQNVWCWIYSLSLLTFLFFRFLNIAYKRIVPPWCYVHGSLFSSVSPCHHSTIFPELLRELCDLPALHPTHKMTLMPVIPPRACPSTPMNLTDSYSTSTFGLYFITYEKLVSWLIYPSFVILYHSVLLSTIVPQLLFYICFCLCLGYFSNLTILVNLFIHSKKQRA